jgi:hypothetical protein
MNNALSWECGGLPAQSGSAAAFAASETRSKSEPSRVTTAIDSAKAGCTSANRKINWQRLGILYARLALGAAFLSGIADRFGCTPAAMSATATSLASWNTRRRSIL